MTRLFFIAAYFAGALATYDYGGGEKTSGDKMAADKSAGYMMNDGADQKNAMDMNMGDKMPAGKSSGETMNGGMDHTMDTKSNTGAMDNSFTVISKCKGGNAPVEQISQPTMNKAATHMVTVGGEPGLVFSPDTLTAMPGDMVEFTFMSMNHTLTQSTFDKPCKKMDGGADSGFLPNPNNTVSPPPTYMFQVKDTKPIWFYCKQKTPASHCGKGMTFSINPTPEKSQAMFKQAAIQQNGTVAASPPVTTTAMPADTTTMPATSTMIPPPPPPAAPPAQPPASPPAAAMPATPQPQNLNAAPPAAPNNMVAGTGSMQGGQCSCSCLCGTGAFPAGAGVGMFGGWSGAVGV